MNYTVADLEKFQGGVGIPTQVCTFSPKKRVNGTQKWLKLTFKKKNEKGCSNRSPPPVDLPLLWKYD